jgi:hypothetical protein
VKSAPRMVLQTTSGIMATNSFFEPSNDGFNDSFNGSFPWLAGTMLAFEACEVIRLRLTMFAAADKHADREAQLMVSEKVDAMFEAGACLMAGASAADIIGRYREHVAANAKRLSAI